MTLTDWATGYVTGVATVVLCLLAGAAYQLSVAEARRVQAADDPYRLPNDAPLEVREGAA